MDTTKTSVIWSSRSTSLGPRESMAFPALEAGAVIELRSRADEERAAVRATLVSVVDSGVVLRCTSEADGQSFPTGTKVQMVTHATQSAYEAYGVVVGGMSAGLAVRIEKAWTRFERRAYPRIQACVFLRYAALDEPGAKRAAAAIRSRVCDRRAARRPELSQERSELAALSVRIQAIEQTLAWMTDLLLSGQTGNAPLTEQEVNLSAAGVAFTVDRPGELAPGSLVEIVMLLPLSDPALVRCTGTVVRVATGADDVEKAAVRYDCVSDADRDAIARYVFQLQRRKPTLY